MTQGERLVRKICDAARDSVRAETERVVDALKTDITINDLPVALRKRAREVQRLKLQLKAATTALKEAGYSVDDDGDVTVDYRKREARKAVEWKRRDQRLAAVGKLETTAIVATLGRHASVVADVLRQLQADLVKV